MPTSSLFSSCNSQLSVYGSFVADKINLMRTYGSMRDETPTTGVKGVPATPPGPATPGVNSLSGRQGRYVDYHNTSDKASCAGVDEGAYDSGGDRGNNGTAVICPSNYPLSPISVILHNYTDINQVRDLPSSYNSNYSCSQSLDSALVLSSTAIANNKLPARDQPYPNNQKDYTDAAYNKQYLCTKGTDTTTGLPSTTSLPITLIAPTAPAPTGMTCAPLQIFEPGSQQGGGESVRRV